MTLDRNRSVMRRRDLAASLALFAGAWAPRPSPAPEPREHDLGVHRLEGPIDLVWTDPKPRGSADWIRAYALRGCLSDSEEGEERLLAGWSLRGNGVMKCTGEHIVQDIGACCFESGATRIFARFSAESGRWAWGPLQFSFFGGSGPYRVLRGEGVIERLMHLPHTAPVGWGFLSGVVAWRRD